MAGLAIKRLTRSDLTLFDYHFKRSPNVRQKGINLDADPFAGELFPRLSSEPNKTQYLVPVTIFGPGEAAEYLAQRPIIKSQKNWRLNGGTIKDPDTQPTRFAQMRPGDFAVMSFLGRSIPESVYIYLVAAASSLTSNYIDRFQSSNDSLLVGG
jgi:hypothetical protein